MQTLLIGVVVFPGSAISDNLGDKAKVHGIPLFDFRKEGGGEAANPPALLSNG